MTARDRVRGEEKIKKEEPAFGGDLRRPQVPGRVGRAGVSAGNYRAAQLGRAWGVGSQADEESPSLAGTRPGALGRRTRRQTRLGQVPKGPAHQLQLRLQKGAEVRCGDS